MCSLCCLPCLYCLPCLCRLPCLHCLCSHCSHSSIITIIIEFCVFNRWLTNETNVSLFLSNIGLESASDALILRFCASLINNVKQSTDRSVTQLARLTIICIKCSSHRILITFRFREHLWPVVSCARVTD